MGLGIWGVGFGFGAGAGFGVWGIGFGVWCGNENVAVSRTARPAKM